MRGAFILFCCVLLHGAAAPGAPCCDLLHPHPPPIRTGLVDDVHGYNFLSGTPDVHDDYFHGTHLAGVLAATCGNGQGVCGMDQGVVLLPCKFLDAKGSGLISNAVRCVAHLLFVGCSVCKFLYARGPGRQVRARLCKWCYLLSASPWAPGGRGSSPTPSGARLLDFA